ncbi:MAG: hypothetical protein AAB728_02755, partial [Patescibacteria group bacterium]
MGKSMCGGITVHWRSIPQELAQQYGLLPVSVGSEERVLRFHFRDPVPRLPALFRGKLGLYAWGNRDNKESRLPKTGWAKAESVDAGKWNWLHPEPVEIPASRGVEKGVWFPIAEGIRGILVKDEKDLPHVYMLTQAASPKYAAKTKHERMPVFLTG